jgi:hypothetical protein
VLQPGKTFQDFRPGVALDDTVAIFIVPPKRGDPPRSDLLQHYFSMTLSKCYLRSQAKLSCITCHDPHFQPEPKMAAFYFRSRCLTCHTEKSCAVPFLVRKSKEPPDDCAGCHMLKRDLKEISHAALTDHRILKESGEAYPETAFHLTTTELSDLVHVNAVPGTNPNSLSPITVLQAYSQLILTRPEYRERYLALAEQLRNSSPDDPAVLEALAFGALSRRSGDGASEASEYLSRAIRQGSTLPADFEQAGGLLIRLGRFSEAVEILRHGIKVIPHDGELYRLLGLCYLSQNKQAEAISLLTDATRMFPENASIRELLEKSGKDSQN